MQGIAASSESREVAVDRQKTNQELATEIGGWFAEKETEKGFKRGEEVMMRR